ncbi:MAG: small ribosomal subunit biogenesis GTPase RsgA [Vulcanimicrobiaceae bacterium]
MRRTEGERLARVVSVGRNAAWIAFEDESIVRLAHLRKTIERQSLVPGDLVFASPLEDERVLVERREPRSFALERATANGRTKTMAANIDGIAVVAALARPAPHYGMIDELLAFAAIHDIGARLIFTKADLADEVDAGAIAATYARLGYVALVANPVTGAGMAPIEAELAGSKTLLIGQSGVGKSSLFGALGGTADVGDVSKTGRGKQTTTTGRLHRFSDGFLIDSPGVGEFELRGCTPAEIALGFREFAPLLGRCRFADCVHRHEPGCAIRGAVADGSVAGSRYESFRAILDREAARSAPSP